MSTKPVSELVRETANSVLNLCEFERAFSIPNIRSTRAAVYRLIQSALDQQAEKYEAALKVATGALKCISRQGNMCGIEAQNALAKIKELMP